MTSPPPPPTVPRSTRRQQCQEDSQTRSPSPPAATASEFGIRVNCISPGAIVTPIFWGGHHTQSAEENELRAQRLTEHFAAQLPLNRAGTPEDIAYAALYLASDESRHTTGHNLMIDAGITVRMAPQSAMNEGNQTRQKVLAGDVKPG